MAKKSSYYNRDKDTINEAVDNPTDVEIVDSFPFDDGNETIIEDSVVEIEPVKETSKSETKKCKIINVTSKNISVDFNGFGVSIDVKNPQEYKKNKVIPVFYSGEIGKPDFKIWVD